MLPQLYVHQSKPESECLSPVANIPYFAKPSGGLWTSTYSEVFGSGWVQWCLGENFRSNPFRSWLLIPTSAVRVFTVHDASDIMWLCNRYRLEGKRDIGGAPPLDWPQIANDFDAVNLTESGQWATRFSQPYNLYGWDCESTIWLRWAFSEVVDLGEVVYETGTETECEEG